MSGTAGNQRATSSRWEGGALWWVLVVVLAMAGIALLILASSQVCVLQDYSPPLGKPDPGPFPPLCSVEWNPVGLVLLVGAVVAGWVGLLRRV